jgi:hypothetical protein
MRGAPHNNTGNLDGLMPFFWRWPKRSEKTSHVTSIPMPQRVSASEEFEVSKLGGSAEWQSKTKRFLESIKE